MSVAVRWFLTNYLLLNTVCFVWGLVWGAALLATNDPIFISGWGSSVEAVVWWAVAAVFYLTPGPIADTAQQAHGRIPPYEPSGNNGRLSAPTSLEVVAASSFATIIVVNRLALAPAGVARWEQLERAQWFRSTRSHRLIWIAPHVKGPVDAPFRSHVYRVVR